MTIKNLRSFYPHHDFYFFNDDKEVQKQPFYHSPIKGFEIKSKYTIFVYI